MRDTIVTLQPIQRVGNSLIPVEPRQFATASDALRAGEEMTHGVYAGAIVRTVEGDAERNEWSEPQVLARFGETSQDRD